MALSWQPKLLIADEPHHARRSTVPIAGARSLELLLRKFATNWYNGGMSILLITHTWGVRGENADVWR